MTHSYGYEPANPAKTALAGPLGLNFASMPKVRQPPNSSFHQNGYKMKSMKFPDWLGQRRRYSLSNGRRTDGQNGRKSTARQHAGTKCRLTFMFNKDTPKHETCVPCVGRVLTRHGRLKSTLRHATLVGCGRCFTLRDCLGSYALIEANKRSTEESRFN